MVTPDMHGKYAAGVRKKYLKNNNFRIAFTHPISLSPAAQHDYSVCVCVCVCDIEMADPACYTMFLFWVMNLTHFWLQMETSLSLTPHLTTAYEICQWAAMASSALQQSTTVLTLS